MSERWHIFKDGRQIGPLSASEIRRGLREGEFDPFDLVAREGSNLRRELVEVDELFFTSKVVYGDEMKVAEANASTQQLNATHSPLLLSGSAQEPVSTPSASPGAYIPVFGPTGADSSRNKSQPRAQAPMLGQGHMALADEAAGAQATVANNALRGQVVRRQRDPKHFLLMNSNGRVLGPMSATEVQSLYYRGVLTGDVNVMRQGSDAKVSLSRFISVMSGNRNPKAQMQGAHPVSGMQGLMQKKAAFTSAPFGIQPMAAMALVAAFTLFLATGFLLIEHRAGKLSSMANKIGNTQNAKKGKRKGLKARSPRAAAVTDDVGVDGASLKGRRPPAGEVGADEAGVDGASLRVARPRVSTGVDTAVGAGVADGSGAAVGAQPSETAQPSKRPAAGVAGNNRGAPGRQPSGAGRRGAGKRSAARQPSGAGSRAAANGSAARQSSGTGSRGAANGSAARQPSGADGRGAANGSAADATAPNAQAGTTDTPQSAMGQTAAPTASADSVAAASAAQVAAAQAAFIRGETVQAPAPVTQIAQPQKASKDRRPAGKAAAKGAKGGNGRPAAKFRRADPKMKFKPLPRGK